ncbi:hypothetical protein Tco_1406548 [Tanacetum coccineum]
MKEVEDEAGPSTFQDESAEFIQGDTLIADILVDITRPRRGAGITILGNIPEQERPESQTLILDPKDKGKGIMKEEPKKKKKLTLQQLRAAETANDEEVARKVAAEWEEEEERKRLAGLERLQDELEDNEMIATEVQRIERVEYLVEYIYTIGDVNASLSKRSPWLDIICEVSVLRTKGINLLDLIRKKVCNGLNTLFWEDPWLDDLVLKHKFLRLYALDNYKQITVVEKINHAFMVDTFRRPPRGDAEEEQLGFHLSRMDGLILTNIPDRWVRSLEDTCEFSVKSVRFFQRRKSPQGGLKSCLLRLMCLLGEFVWISCLLG